MDQLGPFQAIWHAWDEAHDDVMAEQLTHFRKYTDIQFDEMEEHLAKGDREAAAREAVDIISIGLTTLRKLGYHPEQIAELAQARAENRMQGRTQEILDKYRRLM